MVSITFTGDKKTITANEDTILQSALKAKIPHTHACGGKGQCSTCRVWVSEGIKNCSARSEPEQKMANLRHFPPEVRLACQTKITGDVSCKRLVRDEEDISLLEEEIATGHATVGEEKYVAMFFSDLRGFTSFSEGKAPYDVVHILNKYFNRVCPSIIKYKGEIDKYMGDGIMAIFGCSNDPNPTLSAIKCALEQLQALKEFNCHLQENYDVTLAIGIGIHYGPVVVGNMGYREKIQFTAIGDTVNMAARIESANKPAGTSLLISQDAYDRVMNLVVIGKTHEADLKGKTGKYVLYEVVGLKD